MMPDEPTDEKLEQRAKNVLLFQLSRSMKTRHQLATILKKREIPEDIANAVLDRFTEAQLIDDAAFARAFVNSRIAVSGKSKSVIARELKQKGVSAQDAEQALSSIDAELEDQTAYSVAKKRYQQLSTLEPEVRRRRLMGFLMRRGFSSQLTARILRDLEHSE
jgi:regulatory protein